MHKIVNSLAFSHFPHLRINFQQTSTDKDNDWEYHKHNARVKSFWDYHKHNTRINFFFSFQKNDFYEHPIYFLKMLDNN